LFVIAPENRGPVLAAALILLVFGVGGFFLPTIMLAVGSYSTVAAGLIAILFVLAFFGIFWLRSRQQPRR
jgi:cytochrome c biogenesis protein CcdA